MCQTDLEQIFRDNDDGPNRQDGGGSIEVQDQPFRMCILGINHSMAAYMVHLFYLQHGCIISEL